MPKLNPTTLGLLIRNHRIKAELTQREVAHKLRVSQSLISKIERGVLQITLMHFLAFADQTQVGSLDIFLGRV